jgi:hypothetical protein
MHRGWLLQRLKKLPDMSPTHDVVRILKISIDTAQRWIHDPYFQQNQVAVKGNAQWLWDKHKLRVWLKAVYFESARVRAENPGGKSAREMLGMPEHYSVRLGRDVIIREEAESD